MDWVFNSRMQCWVAEVAVSGVFRLTREEVLDNVTVRKSKHMLVFTHFSMV